MMIHGRGHVLLDVILLCFAALLVTRCFVSRRVVRLTCFGSFVVNKRDYNDSRGTRTTFVCVCLFC